MKRPRLTDLDTFPCAWVTPPELAEYLDCDRRTILRMIDAGSLPAIRVGRNWRIPVAEAKRRFDPARFHVERTSKHTA